MNRFLDDTLSCVARAARAGLRKLLLLALLCLSGLLIGAAGIGFLTTWAFMTLSMVLGPRPALLLTGLGLMLVAGCLLGLVRLLSKPDPAVAPDSPPVAAVADANNAASLVAFTAAFVLGRYLKDGKRG